ncbi:MAG: phosphodiesterase [Clostridia bacterium]|nr:phosphodiesterase [Clostridia bacterium]MEE0410020.1 phosphodiesterase [Clostridia bacterium]
MKIMIASDIHGSEKWARRLAEEYRKSGARRLVLLGDILYHGPRNDLTEGHNPKAVIEILNTLKDEIVCVRGNCDAEVDQMVLDFPIMSDKARMSIEGGHKMYFTHGHIYSVDNFPDAEKGDIVVQGHTHIPMDEMRNGIRRVNPGSVSLPKGGSDHQCLLYDDGEFVTIKL